jgi:hypothetical protein
VLIDPHTIYDSYQDLTFSEAKARLNLFAREMITKASAKSYIACYGRSRTERQAAAKRAKAYLIARFRIKAERLEIVDGGFRPRTTIELYLSG